MNKNKEQRIKIRPLVKAQIASSQGWRCKECNELFGPIYHIDHQKALCLGGNNQLNNLVALCAGCHTNKTVLDLQSYYDKETEKRTGKSRFFNPLALEYLG